MKCTCKKAYGLALGWPIEMVIDFKTLTMTELRMRPGEVLDRVADGGEAFIIERNGRQAACLVPLSVFLPNIAPARIVSELDELSRAGIEAKTTVTADREVLIKVPVEGAARHYSIDVLLPHHYPNAAPRIYVDAVDEGAPHRFADGALCIFGVHAYWNPGKSSVREAVDSARRWLEHYEAWRASGDWQSGSER